MASHVPPVPGPKAREAGPDLLRGRMMAHSLGALLDQVPGARSVLPHLAALERALATQGAGALRRVPAHWLGKICTQLSGLPLPKDDAPLHDLLDRLIAEQEMQRADAAHLPFDMHRTVVIEEISHTDYEAAARAQQTTLLGDA